MYSINFLQGSVRDERRSYPVLLFFSAREPFKSLTSSNSPLKEQNGSHTCSRPLFRQLSLGPSLSTLCWASTPHQFTSQTSPSIPNELAEETEEKRSANLLLCSWQSFEKGFKCEMVHQNVCSSDDVRLVKWFPFCLSLMLPFLLESQPTQHYCLWWTLFPPPIDTPCLPPAEGAWSNLPILFTHRFWIFLKNCKNPSIISNVFMIILLSV